MNFLSEYGSLINFAIAIFLAIFLYKKIKAIHYAYYIKTTIVAVWNLLRTSLNFRNRIGYKQVMLNLYDDLPGIDKVVFFKNIVYFYLGCLAISLLDLLRLGYKFDFVDFFISDPIEYLLGITLLIAAALFFKMLGLHKKDGFINTAVGNMNNQVAKKNTARKTTSFRTKSDAPKPSQPTKKTQAEKAPVPEQQIPQKLDMRTDSAERKTCYNCVYWTGQRSFKAGYRSHIEYLNEEARCAPNGPRLGAKMSPRATCNGFVKLG